MTNGTLKPGLWLGIKPDVSELGRVSEWLHRVGDAHGLPVPLVWDFDLCAHEAIANIVNHAGEQAKVRPIQLELTIDAGQVTLVIRDEGRAFNPLEAPLPEFAKNLKDAKIGGLGIHLIRTLMDECGYERQNGCNCLILKAYLPVIPHSARTHG